ncbi:MAG: helix-turn-helix domain-containing protein, partial [Duncaniella sp.]|nr:helix-turn-helix domain-containing protein [Duncaniella sp.]
LLPAVDAPADRHDSSSPPQSVPGEPPQHLTLDQMERRMIAEALADNGGNLTAAATQLGLTRQTLYNKLKRQH